MTRDAAGSIPAGCSAHPVRHTVGTPSTTATLKVRPSSRPLRDAIARTLAGAPPAAGNDSPTVIVRQG
jgi:hypothetical protein